MEVIRLFRLGLFIYESIRFFLMAAAFVILRPAGPWVLFAASNVLFPLMTLFLWLDFSRYGTYTPLYLAGKFVSVFSLLGWSIVSLISSPAVWLESRAFEGILLCGDLLAVAAVLFIIKSTQASVVVESEIIEGE